MKEIIKSIGVFVRPTHSQNPFFEEIIKAKELVLELLEKERFESFVIDDLRDKNAIEKTDAFLCLGGDGTMLGALRMIHLDNKPCFGVRMGNLGFLTAIELNELKSFLQALKQNAVKLEEHLALEGRIEKTYFYAINEIVIAKKEALGVLDIQACVSHTPFNTYKGDGLIIATPLGSTAYNLSANGPIVHALSQSYIVTPLCDFSLTQRPLVLGAEFCLSFCVNKDALVVIDGQATYDLKAHQKLYIQKSPTTTKLLQKNSRDYFKVLKEKLLWGESPSKKR
ncbi:NAD(+)/NADH kinase [Helicobacter cetorum]|uniref:NAD kinase n=1 Tax=Helicobacter cetorum (strain ATCC BAA-540 / CCUG 52418 / MIT 99-5656) TaxID=1163745 RepID=I0ESN1_HELCM|nr:NAD(+)/NADH kinase [Helicobacter cetorum]AFI05950.1 putative inorganic polyphosphate/ATP-NAD kinase [Helicobacter cetorum MIT 99-5656]